jgi:hypothetical protein
LFGIQAGVAGRAETPQGARKHLLAPPLSLRSNVPGSSRKFRTDSKTPAGLKRSRRASHCHQIRGAEPT